MNCEIVGVGTELLLGQIANTNAQHISAELAGAGANVYFHTVVGDNLDRMSTTIARALERSDCVVITGGLGPTPDDVTREGVAAAVGVDLRRSDELAETITSIFERLGRVMPEENLRQADLPEGAVPIPPVGTAPGFRLDVEGKLLFALPGVPWEMKAMLDGAVLPVVRARSAGVIVSRQVLVVGLGESHTHDRIRDIVDRQTNPTIAFLAGGGQVRVRITAKADDEATAVAMTQPVEAQVRDRLGVAAVPGSHPTLAHALVALLRSRTMTISVAESLTGGLIGAELTQVAGASDVFVGSLVCYDVDAKANVARVPRAVLDGPGPVSEEAAAALAEGAAAVLGSDLAISATGVAGPDPHGGHPIGTVFVAATSRGTTEVRKVQAYGDRSNVRMMAATAAMDIGRRLVETMR